MSFLAWIIVGLIAGFIARAIYPGKQPGGTFATVILGMVGAVLGGWIGSIVFDVPRDQGLSLGGIIWAIIGSLVLLFIWSLFTGRSEAKGRRPV